MNNGEIRTIINDDNPLDTNCLRIGVKTVGDETITSRYYDTNGSQSAFMADKRLMQFFAVKSSNKSEALRVKLWYFSRWHAETVGVDEWYDTSAIDISPSIEKVIGISTVVGSNTFDLLFDIKDANAMQEIAEYYKIEPPMRKEDFCTTAEHNWNMFYTYVTHPALEAVKLGGIIFTEGVPVMFKYYKISP